MKPFFVLPIIVTSILLLLYPFSPIQAQCPQVLGLKATVVENAVEVSWETTTQHIAVDAFEVFYRPLDGNNVALNLFMTTSDFVVNIPVASLGNAEQYELNVVSLCDDKSKSEPKLVTIAIDRATAGLLRTVTDAHLDGTDRHSVYDIPVTHGLARYHIPLNDVETVLGRISTENYLPIWTDTYTFDNQTFVNLIFEENPSKYIWNILVDADEETYKKTLAELGYTKSYELTHIKTRLTDKDEVLYTAIFVNNPKATKWYVYENVMKADHVKIVKERKAAGFELVSRSVMIEQDGEIGVTALYSKAPKRSWRAKGDLSLANYQKELAKARQAGRIPTNLSVRVTSKAKAPAFDLIFADHPNPFKNQEEMSAADLETINRNYEANGYQIHILAGYEWNKELRYAAVWVKTEK